MPPPGRFLKLEIWFFYIAAFCKFLRKLQGSVTFGSWDMNMDKLVLEVTLRPKLPIYLILCWFRVWYIADAVFCKLHLPCVKSVIILLLLYIIIDVVTGSTSGSRSTLVNYHVTLTWGQIFNLTFRGKKSMFRYLLKRETRWCLNYSAVFLSSKVICEKRYILIWLIFILTRPGGVNIWPKKVNSGTIGPRTFQGFVWSLSHSSISTRGEMAWGVATPPPHVRSRMGK